MKYCKMTAHFLSVIMIAVSCTACTEDSVPDLSDTSTIDELSTITDNSSLVEYNDSSKSDLQSSEEKNTLSAEKNEYYEFDLKCSVRDGNYIYVCDDVSESSINKCEINGENSKLPFEGRLVCVDGDTIYYVDHSWQLHSYSKSTEEENFYFKVGSWSTFLLKRDGLIYYQEGKQIYSYDINTCQKTVLLKDNIVSCYAAENKIYYLSNSQTDDKFDNNGVLKYYDLNSKDSGILYNENINKCNFNKTGSDIFFWTTDKEDYTQCAKVYKVNKKDNSVDHIKTIQTEGELYFNACYDNILVYQEFDNKNCVFSTNALLLTDGTIKTDKNANIQLISSNNPNSHAVGNPDPCVLRDEAGDNNFYFDIKSGKLKNVDNVSDSKITFIYYCDGENCIIQKNGSDKFVAETLKLSDIIYSKEDALKKPTIESSPDNEYVQKDHYVLNSSGYVSAVPELTFDSDDADRINSEIETSARECMYGLYYRSLVADNYLTLFTSVSYPGAVTYKIYTIDLTTGKQLSNNDIISLYTNDTEYLFDKLLDEYKYQLDFTYKYGKSQMESELSNRELTNIIKQLSEEEIERYAAEKTINDFQLGYYGENELICCASFKNAVGTDINSHIFKFEFE